MNNLVDNFFSQTLNEEGEPERFHKVIPIHQERDLSLAELQVYVPNFNRGWHELARVSSEDRLEFVFEFWRSTLPYLPHCDEGITQFFENLDDIGFYFIQKKAKDPFQAKMVYSLADNSSFFQGDLPITEANLLTLHAGINHTLLPNDYLAFLQIHDGFSKYTDTGLVPSSRILSVFNDFQSFIKARGALVTKSGEQINLHQLYPFYESFGLHCYQCFYGEWYPDQEMGNLYYSGVEHSLSDFEDREQLPENLAFPTFIDWLVFYLEKIA
jgi:hypothetical protein